jgi:tRNA G46 methylase TrmB
MMVHMTQRQHSNEIGAIQSNQLTTHENLASLVRKHLTTPWQKPIPDHTAAAAKELISWLRSDSIPWILDSFCGTGMSTRLLAEQYPDHLIIGVDQSQSRLTRHQYGVSTNYRLVRAECEPLWQCLGQAGLQPKQHFLLYPNPWPKAKHASRRIHGHPGFADLLRLGGTIELRTNWAIYAQEFAQAFAIAGGHGELKTLPLQPPLTLFEQKYQSWGQLLWQYQGVPPNSIRD